MSWKVPKMWQDEDVWILGGGSSVSKEFDIPQNIINKVLSGSLPPSVYSNYLKPLHNKHVIGINVAYLIGDWLDMVFFGDNNFFLQHMQGLADYPGLKVSCSPVTIKHPWVKYLPRDTKKRRGISSNNRSVSWNHNSGAAAISVAAYTGANRIILLGFDMKLNNDKRQHWHDVYKRGVYDDPNKLKKLPFYRHLAGFKFIAQDAARMGIEIINASPNSAISDFPKIAVSKLL